MREATGYELTNDHATCALVVRGELVPQKKVLRDGLALRAFNGCMMRTGVLRTRYMVRNKYRAQQGRGRENAPCTPH